MITVTLKQPDKRRKEEGAAWKVRPSSLLPAHWLLSNLPQLKL